MGDNWGVNEGGGCKVTRARGALSRYEQLRAAPSSSRVYRVSLWTAKIMVGVGVDEISVGELGPGRGW